MKRQILASFLLTAGGPAWAQDSTATPPVHSAPLIEVGWTARHVSGNLHRYLQYATSPEGFYLREFSYDPWALDFSTAGSFLVRTPGEDDYLAAGDMKFFHGRTWLAANARRNKFFDPDPTVLDKSQRTVLEGYARQKFGNDFSVALNAWRDEEDQYFPAPADALRQRTYNFTGEAGGSFLGGFGQLTFTNWRYFDRTNVLPDTDVKLYGVSYARELFPNMNVEGSFFRSDIKPSGGVKNKVETVGVNASWDLSDATTALFQYRRERLDLPTVQNAYVRDRGYGRGSLIHRWKGWQGEFSYRQMDIERVRADRTYVDTPTTHTFEGRLSGRISDNVRMTLRGVRETLDGKYGMTTDDPRALYWRNRVYGQLAFDATMENSNAYLQLTYNEDRNDPRHSKVRNRVLTIGGSTQPSANLDLYAEATNDSWTGRTNDQNNPNLNEYFPDAGMWVIGANVNVNPDLWWNLNYSEFFNDNANPLALPAGNVRGRFLTAGVHYRAKAGYEIGLSFAPWKYTDNLYAQTGYESTLITLSANVKF